MLIYMKFRANTSKEFAILEEFRRNAKPNDCIYYFRRDTKKWYKLNANSFSSKIFVLGTLQNVECKNYYFYSAKRPHRNINLT